MAFTKLSPDDRCLLQDIRKKLCELEAGQFNGELIVDGVPVNGVNPLPVETGSSVIDTIFSVESLPYTVPAGVNSYSITTQGSVAADGVTVPSGTPFTNFHPSQDGTVLSPEFTDVSGGSVFVTLGIKL